MENKRVKCIEHVQSKAFELCNTLKLVLNDLGFTDAQVDMDPNGYHLGLLITISNQRCNPFLYSDRKKLPQDTYFSMHLHKFFELDAVYNNFTSRWDYFDEETRKSLCMHWFKK